jgi:hypothetical protein
MNKITHKTLCICVYILKRSKIIIAVKAVVNNNMASESPSAVSAIETCGLLIH